MVVVSEGLAGLLTLMIARPLLPTVTKAVLPSGEIVTASAKFDESRLVVSEGLAGLLTLMIAKPLVPSATKAVLPSAERVTDFA